MADNQSMDIEFTLNGERVRTAVKANMTLVDLLRYQIGLTGTKKACERGECGSCTVLLDGKPVNSCLMLAAQVNGREVMTIEGFGKPESLHPLQQAFIDHAATQCGFCTPGMLLSAKALLDENPSPTEDDVKAAIAGNFCRCTGYIQPIQAILDAANRMKK